MLIFFLKDHYYPTKMIKRCPCSPVPTASWEYVYPFFRKTLLANFSRKMAQNFWVWWWKPGFWMVCLIWNRFPGGVYVGMFYLMFWPRLELQESSSLQSAVVPGFSPVLDCNNRMVGWRLYGLRMDVQRFSVGPGRISGDKVRSEQILNTLPWVYFQLVMLWHLIVILALSWQGFS